MNDEANPAAALQNQLSERMPSMKIIGVGGAGSNAVDRLKMEDLGQIPLAAVNTDAQALSSSPVESKLLLGRSVTRGLGTGGDPEVGASVAAGDVDAIRRLVSGTDLVFLLAGMGGGTGSGAAPIVAKCASEAGAVVISFVTLPFTFEGSRRQKQAEEGLVLLRRSCDAVIPLPNDILLQQLDEDASVLDAFEKADDWVARGVRSIWAILSRTGLINLDFATLRQVFCNQGGKTLFGLGAGFGENRVADAINDLLLCPLLHTPGFSRRADRLLVNIVGGPDLAIGQVNQIMGIVNEHFGRDAHVVMGAVIDEAMAGSVEICVLGTTDISNRTSGQTPTVPTAARPAPASQPQAAPKPADAPAVAASAQDRQPKERVEKPVAVTAAVPVADDVRSGADGATAPVRSKAAARVAQEEFAFSEEERLGYFGETGANLFQGQNLDVPTYMRRGIRIVLN